MDPKTRYERLKADLAAGLVSDTEFQALSQELLKDGSQDDDLPSSDFPDVQGKDDPDAHPSSPIYMEMLQAGMEIGPQGHRFRLERRLGQEEQSRVWRARLLNGKTSPDGKEQSPFRALKIFARRLGDRFPIQDTSRDDKFSRMDLLNLRASLVRIRARATLAASLIHPNIVRVYGWHQGEDGWPFVEMEYLVGCSLDQWLHREGSSGLGWNRVLTLLRPVASVLDYVHREHHLAHRNLKPGNVFVTDGDLVKVLDFGLTHQSRDYRSTMSVNDLGLGDGRQDLPSEPVASSQIKFKQDIGALAALLYEMLTGNPFYGKEGPIGQDPYTWPMLSRGTQSNRAASSLEEVVKPAELTESAWEVLQAGMAYQEETCPASAGELLRQLEAAQTPVPAKQSRRIFGGLTVAIVSLMVVAGGLYLWRSQPVVPIEEGSESRSSPSVTDTVRSPDSLLASDSEPESGFGTPLARLSSEQVKLIEREQDDRAWAAAQRLGTEAAYRLYLQRCPACAYQEETEAALVTLQQEARINRLKARFEAYLEARELSQGKRPGENALTVLQELRRVAPQDPFIAAGRRRVALAYEALARENLAAGDHDQARRWLERGRQVQPELDLWVPLTAALDQARARAQDTAAYGRAREQDTQQAYQAYLAQCAPGCAYQEPARAALERLKAAPPSPSNPLFRDALASGGHGPEMVLLPGGRFRMGSPLSEAGRYSDETPHTVSLAQAFAIGRHEITFADYDRFARATGRALPADEGWGRDGRPVINVSWRDARAYAAWLSQQTGQRYRLPTEAEWEYAARAGTETARFWGQDPDQGCGYANGADLTGKAVFSGWTAMNCRDGFIYTAPAGQYQPNDSGLYDTLGNVLEWTCSSYETKYQGAEQLCASSGTRQRIVARGGSWSDQPRDLRAAVRYHTEPESQDYFLGFRLARESESQ